MVAHPTRCQTSRTRQPTSSARPSTRPKEWRAVCPSRAARPASACRRWPATSRAPSTSRSRTSRWRRSRVSHSLVSSSARCGSRNRSREEPALFAGVINNAKAAVSHLVLKYVARASVAIPFIIALGFALAAVAVMLVDRFGHVTAYWLMAGGLAAIGAIAAIAVSVKEHEEEVAEQKAEQADTGEVASDAAAQAMVQAPLALLGALISSPGGAAGAFKVARV